VREREKDREKGKEGERERERERAGESGRERERAGESGREREREGRRVGGWVGRRKGGREGGQHTATSEERSCTYIPVEVVGYGAHTLQHAATHCNALQHV